ncbi:MAG: hypothetical protein U9R08_02760 [Nanoarchaeota archaeon]|nr:hypothetical protein [Nanoarchaeota archaeon]
MINYIINKLRDYLNKDIGIILNLDNCNIFNTGKHIVVKIPHKSFEKYKCNIVSAGRTRYRLNNGRLAPKGQRDCSFKPGQKGFLVSKIKN